MSPGKVVGEVRRTKRGQWFRWIGTGWLWVPGV